MEPSSGSAGNGLPTQERKVLPYKKKTRPTHRSPSSSRSPSRSRGRAAAIVPYPTPNRPPQFIDLTRTPYEFPAWRSDIIGHHRHQRDCTINEVLVAVPFFNPAEVAPRTGPRFPRRLLEWRSTGDRLQLRMTDGTVIEVATAGTTTRLERGSTGEHAGSRHAE